MTQEYGPPPLNWWPTWGNKPVAIVASGPSAKSVGVELLRNRANVIAVNESYQLCPWADVLYGCDAKWWQLRNYVPDFGGLKIVFDVNTAINHPPIKYITVRPESDKIHLERLGVIGSGGCSGFQALNLAVQFRARRILLVGFDMRVDLETHWHGRHPPPCSNPSHTNFVRWQSALGGAFEMLTCLGIKVINCSPESSLTTYPKMSIERALA